MAGVQSPCWELSPAAIALRERVGVFLQDPGAILPVLAAKVQVKAIPHAGGPR